MHPAVYRFRRLTSHLFTPLLARLHLVSQLWFYNVAGLRLVAHALLEGAGGLPKIDGQVRVSPASSTSQGHGTADGPAASAAAAYMRDRVGVPRDLPLPAARQFRAHLNWFIDSLS